MGSRMVSFTNCRLVGDALEHYGESDALVYTSTALARYCVCDRQHYLYFVPSLQVQLGGCIQFQSLLTQEVVLLQFE